MGKTTTAMHYGDLSASKKAVDEFHQYILDGQQAIPDSIVGGYKSPAELLEEATLIWKRRSEETLQHILNTTSKYLPHNPRIAQSVYQQALAKNKVVEKVVKKVVEADPEDPKKTREVTKEVIEEVLAFHPDAQAKLEEVKRQIEDWLAKLGEAEDLVARADRQEPLKAYGSIQQAENTFPYLDGIERRLASARQAAINALTAQADESLSQADAALNLFQFKQARAALQRVREKILAKWAETPLPEALAARQEAITKLDEKIQQVEKDRQEYFARQKSILEYKSDPARLKMAFRMLEELKQDPRFADYAELRALEGEMDQVRGIDEVLPEAQNAQAQRDWERVYNLTKDKVGDSNLDPQVRQELQTLFDRADLELKLSTAQCYLLEDRDVAAANRILSPLAHPNHPFSNEVKSRMAKELAMIATAIQDDKVMEPIFNYAKEKAGRSVEEQIEALHLFRHVGGVVELQAKAFPRELQMRDEIRYKTVNGEKVEIPLEERGRYRLSLKTVAARQEAARLAEMLRNTVLKNLEEQYQKYADSPQPPPANRLQVWGRQARGLREVNLLYTEREKNLVRWLEIEMGKHQAGLLEKNGRWKEAIEIWEELNFHYPFTEEVGARLRRARLESVLQQARSALEMKQTDAALNQLKQAQQDPALQHEAELLLLLAEVHAAREDFDDALALIDRIEARAHPNVSDELLAERRKYFRRERGIFYTLQRAEDAKAAGQLREALDILLAGRKDEEIADSGRIQREIESVFRDISQELLRTVESELGKNTSSGKIAALTRLLDLRQIEQQIALPNEQSQALPKIKILRQDLKMITQQVLARARDLLGDERSNKSLAEERSRIKESADQLDALRDMLAPEESQIEQVQLNDLRRQIQDRLEKLNEIDGFLQQAQEQKLWEEAIHTGDFSKLENLENEISRRELPSFLEQTVFQRKLAAWRAMYSHILEGIARIQKLYTAEDAFEEVQKTIAQLRLPPDNLVMSDAFSAQGPQLSETQLMDYKTIFEWMGTTLRVPELYGNATFIGWDEVNQAAQSRQKELQAWQNWEQALGSAIFKAASAWQVIEKQSENTKLRVQKQNWEALLQSIEEAIKIAEIEPLNEGTPVPIRSGKANAIYKKGQEQKRELYKQKEVCLREIEKSDAEITKLGGIPTLLELRRYIDQKDVAGLERRLAAFEHIGPSTPEEAKSLQIHQNILREMKDNSKKTWWRWW